MWWPHQHELIQDETSREQAITAGLGAGKTRVGAGKALRVSHLNGPACTGLVVAQSHDALRRTVLPTLFALLKQHGSRYHYNASSKILEWDGGGPIHFSSAERPDLLPGSNQSWLWLDESAIHDATIMQEAGPRVRDPSARVLQTWHTSTFRGMNWFYDRLQQRDAAGNPVVRQIKATTLDNKVLGAAYAQHLETIFVDDAMRRQYIMGEAAERHGNIYTQFRDDVHVQRCLDPRAGMLICGGDFNVGHMVTVVGCAQERPRPWVHWFMEHVTMGGTTTLLHWTKVRDWLMAQGLAHMQPVRGPGGWQHRLVARNGTGPVVAVVDASAKQRHPSASETDEQHVRSLGFTVRCPASNPWVDDRIATVEQWLSRVDVLFCPDGCPRTITAFRRHSYKPGTSEPQKKWNRTELQLDHYCDAAGYVMVELNPVELRIGAVWQ